MLLSLTGNWVEAAAFGYVVLLLGGSPAALGIIGFLNTIPNLVWGLPAGVLADRYDRRRLLLAFQGANMAVAVLLAVLWQTGTLSVPLLGAIALIGGSLGTLSYPAFQGVLASTVPGEDLESAVAINSLFLQVARFVGPAIAGVLLAQAGPTWVFAVNAVSFLGVLIAVLLLPGSGKIAGQVVGKLGGSMREAVRYVFGQRSISSLLLLTALAGVFGTPPIAFMLPAIARVQLHGGAGTLGALTASIGLGSLLGSGLLLRLARRANKGEPVLASFLLTALAVAAVGASQSIALSLAPGCARRLLRGHLRRPLDGCGAVSRLRCDARPRQRDLGRVLRWTAAARRADHGSADSGAGTGRRRTDRRAGHAGRWCGRDRAPSRGRMARVRGAARGVHRRDRPSRGRAPDRTSAAAGECGDARVSGAMCTERSAAATVLLNRSHRPTVREPAAPRDRH